MEFCSDVSNTSGWTNGQEQQEDADRAVTDAAVSLYTNLSLFRQQLPPHNQMSGVIDGAGTVCSHGSISRSHYYLRSPTVASMSELKRVFESCVIAAATTSGEIYGLRSSNRDETILRFSKHNKSYVEIVEFGFP